jgi:hypothetical protein
MSPAALFFLCRMDLNCAALGFAGGLSLKDTWFFADCHTFVLSLET